MSHTIRRLLPLIAALALVLCSAATASAYNYAGLGDSYSAGYGANSANLDSTCGRNTYAYPYLVAQQKGYALNFAACGGAVTGDIVNTQAPTLNSTTNLVTLTIGGNDIGFASLIVACTTLGCSSQITSSNNQIATQLPAKLDAAYNAIRSYAPNAQVIVLGYGRPFAHRTCLAATGVSLSEEDSLNALTDNLNNTIKARAQAHGFTYADPNPYWSGHDVCSSNPFTNGLNLFRSSDSYHPTRNGYSAGYTPLVRSIIG